MTKESSNPTQTPKSKPNPMIDKLIKKIKNFGATEFKINGTKFSIEKLPPMKGFRVAEEIRVNLAEAASKFDIKGSSEIESSALFFQALLALSPDFIDTLMEKMFECIQFTGKDTGQESGWQSLSGSEDSAFINFEVINIYEVLWRALFVNFHGSFSGIASAFPGMAQVLQRLNQKT